METGCVVLAGVRTPYRENVASARRVGKRRRKKKSLAVQHNFFKTTRI